MKIAVCLFGQLRGDEETFASIKKHLVDPNSADVFVHTWNYYDGVYYDPIVPSGQPIDSSIRASENCEYRKKMDISKLTDLISIMRPVNMMAEEQVVFDITRHLSSNMKNIYPGDRQSAEGHITSELISDYQRFCSQSLSKKRVISMVDDTYDVVFFLRNDLLMIRNFVIGEVVDGVYASGDHNRIFDQYFYGNLSSMKLVSVLSDNVDNFLENHNRGFCTAYYEYHLAHYIDLCNLPIHNTDIVSHFYQSPDGRYHVGIKY